MIKQSPWDVQKMDLLKELTNIGVGNAVTALSTMLGEERIAMEVPHVSLVPLQDVPALLGGADTPVAGTYLETAGELRLTFFFVMSISSMEEMISFLLPAEMVENEELRISVLMEVGNIMIGAYLNALSMLAGITFLATPPKVAIDMVGAILGAVAAEALIVDDEIVLLKTNISASKLEIEGSMLIIPDSGVLQKLFNLMGIA